ncbi:MAG TPA: hypothetical protein VEW47_11750 [Candidatus Dormibacteraeota bacterium]|nr:hypothetical protein [Candidatus Dormibacteraeota bacterium]
MPTSDGDADLKVVIKALLDSKGFEEAQLALKKMKGATDDAAPGFKAINQEISRREIKVFTAELLQGIGVMQGAGAAGRVAAEGFALMTGGMGLVVNLLLALGGLFAVTVIPKISEYSKESAEAKKKQDELTQSIITQLPQLEELAKKIGNVNTALAEQVKAVRSEALKQQSREIGENTGKVIVLEQKWGDLTDKIAYFDKLLKTAAPGSATASRVQKLRDEAAATLDEINRLSAVLTEQLAAEEKGIIVEDMRRTQTDKVTQSTKDRKQATEDLIKLQREMDAAFRRSDEQHFKEEQFLTDLTTAEGERGKMAVKGAKEAEEAVHKSTMASGKAALQEARQAVAERKMLRERANAERQFHEDSIASGVQAAAVFAGLFTKNKAINIAAALIDTYAAADKALNQYPGPPWTIPFAALAVATGLANVKAIESAGAGFDDPFADRVAAKMGRKSAEDFARHFGGTFSRELPAAMAQQVTHNYTTIDRGITLNTQNHSIIGARRTEQLKQLKRDLVIIDRMYNRGKIGG